MRTHHAVVLLLSAALLCRIERSSAFSPPPAVAGPCASRRHGFDAAARRTSNTIGGARLGKVASSRASCERRSSVPSRPSLSTAILRSGTNDDNEGEAGPLLLAASCAGLVAQPVVWISLYFVAMTGAGLPSGPLGLLGALEGISYLVVVGFVGASLYRKVSTGGGLPSGPGGMLGAAEGLSLLGGLVVLAGLVVDQGCVPNARPILDYSEFLPVCSDKPGLFGE